MTNLEILPALMIFIVGLITGVGAMLVVNKLRSGSVSPGRVKKEMRVYQEQVEAHFEQTSKKFKNMAAQYQDLYQHLSVGATTLCRPENVAPGLTDQRSPLDGMKKVTTEKRVKPGPGSEDTAPPQSSNPDSKTSKITTDKTINRTQFETNSNAKKPVEHSTARKQGGVAAGKQQSAKNKEAVQNQAGASGSTQ